MYSFISYPSSKQASERISANPAPRNSTRRGVLICGKLKATAHDPTIFCKFTSFSDSAQGRVPAILAAVANGVCCFILHVSVAAL